MKTTILIALLLTGCATQRHRDYEVYDFKQTGPGDFEFKTRVPVSWLENFLKDLPPDTKVEIQ